MKKRLQISALARSLALAAATAMMLLALAGLAANRVHAGAASAPALATQPIVVDGDITADTIWRAADAPYFLVVKPIRILSTATLTIEAGVEVRFQTASSLTVEGGLAAQGTQEHQVFLIGSDGAAWQGLIAGPAARGVTLQSATISGTEPARLLECDLSGVTQLRLSLTSRGLDSKSNFAVWAAPTLIK